MLTFDLKHGDGSTLESFKRQLKMAGQSTAHLPTKPTPSIVTSQYIDDFYNLCTTRPTGMGVGVISWLNVRQYAQCVGYDDFSTYFLHTVVKVLDPIYVEHSNESIRARSQGGAKS